MTCFLKSLSQQIGTTIITTTIITTIKRENVSDELKHISFVIDR